MRISNHRISTNILPHIYTYNIYILHSDPILFLLWLYINIKIFQFLFILIYYHHFMELTKGNGFGHNNCDYLQNVTSTKY